MSGQRQRHFIKVSRHGERLWLEVKEHLPNGAVRAAVANNPICWPQKMGDELWIKPDEIVDRMFA